MDLQTYKEYLSKDVSPDPIDSISVRDFKDQSDRTLTYGYDFERNSWHEDGKIGFLHFNHKEILDTVWYLTIDLVPPKRAYPEYTDLEFANLMRERFKCPLNFTTFNENHRPLNEDGYYAQVKD